MSSDNGTPITNAAAARITLDTLHPGEIDTALANLVLTLAYAVDDEPTNASLARQYREALNDLMGRYANDTDDFARMLAEIQHEANAVTPDEGERGSGNRKQPWTPLDGLAARSR